MAGFWKWLAYGEPMRREEVPPSDPSTVHNIPSREVSGRSVSSREALSLGAVYRAVEIRAVAAKQISIDSIRNGQPLDPVPGLLRRPDPFMSRAQFVEMTVMSMNLNGNAYWRVTRDPDTRAVSSLEVLNPNDVVIRTSNTGRVLGYQYQGRDYSVNDIHHLSRMRIPGSPYGLGPIQAAQAELRGAIDVTGYAADWLFNGDVPSGILTSDSIVMPEDATRAKEQWEESRGGRRSVAVLGKGLSYQQVFLSPKDAQFIESQQWSVQQIARLFGVPSSLMMVAVDTNGSSQTYQNVEQDWLGFVRFGLMNDLMEIEDALTEFLPSTQRAKFNIEALLRADTKSRYEAHSLALSAGWMTKDEVRGIEGLGPLPASEEIVLEEVPQTKEITA